MISAILDKYNAAPNGYHLPESDAERDEQARMYKKLVEKWEHKVGDGWYGFAISNAPVIWFKIIDEYLEHLSKTHSSLEIHQIKIKFGGLRFYVEPYVMGMDKLEAALQDDRLVW